MKSDHFMFNHLFAYTLLIIAFGYACVFLFISDSSSSARYFESFTTAAAGTRSLNLHSGTYGSFQDGYLIGCDHVGYVYAAYTR